MSKKSFALQIQEIDNTDPCMVIDDAMEIAGKADARIAELEEKIKHLESEMEFAAKQMGLNSGIVSEILHKVNKT